jgi:HAE1 family hydrophobic/amphiphilic exporter-1
MNLLEKIPGTSDVSLSSKEGSPEIRVDLDRQKLTSLGLTMEDVGSTLWTALQGNDDAKLKDGDKNYPIRVRLDEADRSRTDLLGSLTVANAQGKQVELKQFAFLERAVSLGKLERMDRNPSIIVKCQTTRRTSGAIASDFERMSKELQWPSGTTFSYIGDLEHQEDSFKGLAWAAAASVIFIYLLLVALFDSFISPFVVMFTIPAALVGALIALACSGYALSIFTLLAMIMLMGLVAKNAILLVDRTNALRAQGTPVREALIEAGRSRLRPILMTTATMVCGMLPLALSQSSGHEFKSGLAWVLIGGLVSSLLLSLVLVPVVYEALHRWGQALAGVFSRTAHAGGDASANP